MSSIKVSICIPTRNRQEVLSITLRSIISDLRNDVEIIVSDNSDEPEKIHSHLPDEIRNNPKIKILRSEKVILSMRQNWERALQACSGNWVAFIGDDDYIDPNVSKLIKIIEDKDDDIDYVGWEHIYYNWPETRKHPTNIAVSLATEVKKWPIQGAYKALFTCHGFRPPSILTPYHGLMRIDLINRVRNLIHRDKIFFKHSNTDYFPGWMAGTVSKGAWYTKRPLSIHGASSKSNSAFVNTNFSFAVDQFHQEQGRDIYPTQIGVEASHTNAESMTELFDQMFSDFARFSNRKSYVGDWKENLVLRAKAELRTIVDEIEFEMRYASLKTFIKKKTDLNLIASFEPAFNRSQLARGLFANCLYLPDNAFGSISPGDLYKNLNFFMAPVEQIGKSAKLVKRSSN